MIIETPCQPRSSHPKLIADLQASREFCNDADTISAGFYPDELMNATFVMLDALSVLTKTPHIVEYLRQHDPMALSQALKATGEVGN